ncbi:response regulator [Pseudomonas stutzeri]|uniref:phosphorylase family protein n=1 Tax=Stutzerimonas stutzeri TaxID=316 RepID=UPI00210F1B16|nr:response regulator [Stutzerimonas stutzeri]MCQ4313901.1 response regulator [Stutzerimonas stutzeri]
MRTLVVDDQYEDKSKVIISILKKVGAIDFELVTSAKDALKSMAKEKFDLLILDLQIPAVLGDDAEPKGGVQLVKEIEVRQNLNRPLSILAITGHAEAYDDSRSFFEERGWSILLGVDDTERLETILRTQALHLKRSKTIEYDVAVITALHTPELEQVLRLPCNFQQTSFDGDDNIYYEGEFLDSVDQPRKILATSAPHMGMAAAAALTATVCVRFKPKLVMMTGISAGVPGDTDIGDILIADPCWDWGSGKLTVRDDEVVFLSAPTQIPLDSSARRIFQYISANGLYVSDIYTSWRGGKRPPNEPRVIVGPVATGSVVLEDPKTVATIQSQNRKAIGVEMEAFGVMSAAYYSGEPRPKAVAIKSVCDFADPTKNNEWQSYAAYTSAQIAHAYITKHFHFN